MIEAALRRHQDNRSAAAKELGISVRTLYYRLAVRGG
ncbi:MAG: helix-turn-helix domain-containing protein [Phycisphaerales bacterium]